MIKSDVLKKGGKIDPKLRIRIAVSFEMQFRVKVAAETEHLLATTPPTSSSSAAFGHSSLSLEAVLEKRRKKPKISDMLSNYF